MPEIMLFMVLFDTFKVFIAKEFSKMYLSNWGDYSEGKEKEERNTQF